MKILELIPTTTLTKIMANQDFNFNKVEKKILKSKLDLDILNLFNTFIKLNTIDYKIEHEMLVTFPPFIVTKEDLECVSYGLKPLKFETTKELILQLDCIETLSLFIVIKHLYNNYKYKLTNKKRLNAIENLRVLQKLDKSFKDVCYGKGMKTYYDQLDQIRNDLIYLDKYINALE